MNIASVNIFWKDVSLWHDLSFLLKKKPLEENIAFPSVCSDSFLVMQESSRQMAGSVCTL